MEQSELDLLQTVPFYHLQTVARLRRIAFSLQDFPTEPPTSTPSSALPAVVVDIAQHLFDAEAIAGVLKDLSELERQLLEELVSCGGYANSRDLALYVQCAHMVDEENSVGYDYQEVVSFDIIPLSSPGGAPLYPRYPEAHPHGIFEQAIRHLLILGLVFWGKQTRFVGRDYSSGMHDGVLIVPQAVIAATHIAWKLDTQTSAESDNSVELNERMRLFQRSLYLYWSLVASSREGIALVNSGLLARISWRQVCEQMGVVTSSATQEQLRLESDVPLLLFIRLLLQQLGLLTVHKNVLRAEAAEDFFSLPVIERVQRCYLAYCNTAFWNEFVHLAEINIRPLPDPFFLAHEETIRARQQIMGRLLVETPDDWHDLNAFIVRTRLHVPYLLFPRQYGLRTERYNQGSNPYNWDFRLRRGWLTHREGWYMVEGGFIRSMILEPLYWLGLAHIGQNKDASAFKLAPSAAAIVQGEPLTTHDESGGRLLVQPNFELVVMAPVEEGLLVTLDSFAERISLEHIAQYRLSRNSVARAIQRGMRAATIIEKLTLAAGDEIPQNIRYSLEEWERQARRIEIWPDVTLLEVAESTLLDELLAADNEHLLFRRRLAPLLAEVYTQKLNEVQELLWQRGSLPALSTATAYDLKDTEPNTIHESQWRLYEDGLLEPCYPVLNLYLVSQAKRFCERHDATDRFWITEASLQRALEQDIPLKHILHFLETYCEGGIPGSLLIRLKLWGGGYREAQQHIHVEQSPLLRLSAEVLEDLQADEELASLLGPVVDSEQRLVHVSQKDLSHVLALLRRRGFRAIE